LAKTSIPNNFTYIALMLITCLEKWAFFVQNRIKKYVYFSYR